MGSLGRWGLGRLLDWRLGKNRKSLSNAFFHESDMSTCFKLLTSYTSNIYTSISQSKSTGTTWQTHHPISQELNFWEDFIVCKSVKYQWRMSVPDNSLYMRYESGPMNGLVCSRW